MEVTSEQAAIVSDTVGELGTISIRVIVLPAKDATSPPKSAGPEVLDQEEGEEFLVDKSKTPVGSYLESVRGKRCVVFSVNGQAQHYLDNGFIVNDLGFKYLRNRMIIAVEVDGLTSRTFAHLMQSSRQGFYQGDEFEAIKRKVVATLKGDPDLEQLELEAEAQIAELQAGDAKVKEYLDQLIDSHHNLGLHLNQGTGAPGDDSGDDTGSAELKPGKIVALFPKDTGASADYPVLRAEPAISSLRLRPNETRTLRLRSSPPHSWPSVSKLTSTVLNDVPELSTSILHLPQWAELALKFTEPKGFDPGNYPLHGKVAVTGRFDGLEEPRQITFGVLVKPDVIPEEPALLDEPTMFMITSRQPIKLRRGGADAHVKLRWDGKDYLLIGSPPAWSRGVKLLDPGLQAPVLSFSDPVNGRFELLVRANPEWPVGQKATLEVDLHGPKNKKFSVIFECLVVEPPSKPEPNQPRLVEGNFPTGAIRRPPYVLKYVTEDQWATTPFWASSEWTGAEAGCYLPPTETQPLTIIINSDMTALKTYRNLLIKEKKAESVIERRVTKYTSHVAFHLYQMYLAAKGSTEEDLDTAEERQRREIERVAMTLIKLMQVSE
jgi:hypothetical protein